MANPQGPQDTKEQAHRIKEAWANIGVNVTYGDLTLAEFQAAITALETGEATVKSLEDQRTKARNAVQDQRRALWSLVKRTRAGAKAKHGDDSDEYERFGGTRLSERRPRRSKRSAGA